MLRRRDKRCVDSIGFEEFRQFFLLLPAGGMLADYRMNALCAGICDVGASVAIHEVAHKALSLSSCWLTLYVKCVIDSR